MFLVFRKQHETRGVTPDREARMQKKCPDKRQSQEEPPLSPGRDMPPAAPVDDEAFARRAGKIIANSSTSLRKARDAGKTGNKRPRGAVDERRNRRTGSTRACRCEEHRANK